jgi:hypothetical protein
MFTLINLLLVITGLYLACGLLFAIAFVIKGAAVTDEGTHGATIGFRIIIIPAAIVFWPLLLRKWMQVNKTKRND